MAENKGYMSFRTTRYAFRMRPSRLKELPMTQEFPIVFPLYPRVTQLDFTGPYEVFARLPGARLILASTTGTPIEADGGITFSQVVRLSAVDRCALLCVPGGAGTIEAMEDPEYLA